MIWSLSFVVSSLFILSEQLKCNIGYTNVKIMIDAMTLSLPNLVQRQIIICRNNPLHQSSSFLLDRVNEMRGGHFNFINKECDHEEPRKRDEGKFNQLRFNPDQIRVQLRTALI